MLEDKVFFKDEKIDFKKLLELGFYKKQDYYKYETKIINNQFSLNIKIDNKNIVYSDVIDLSTNDEFILYYVPSSNGEFVGKIRDEYNNILEKVKINCCSKNPFKSEYSNMVIEYIKNKYNDELEFLWEKFDDNAVWRNKSNNKWYGLLLTVEKKKLGLEDDGIVEVIDLLLEPEKIEKLVDNKKIFAGYHMNKKHWITIKMDGSVDINEIYDFIDNSYKICENKA